MVDETYLSLCFAVSSLCMYGAFVSYSAVAGFDPLLRAALRHSRAGNSQRDAVAREATFVALLIYGVLRSGSNSVEDSVAPSWSRFTPEVFHCRRMKVTDTKRHK